MTTLQPPSSSYLQNMLAGEQMELSPHPGMDDDIDIDLDLDPGPSNDQDNDYIIEDAKSENTAEHLGPSTEVGNDDVMHDGDHMCTDAQEKDVEFPDEELYDAHDQVLTDDPSNKQQDSSAYAPNATTFESSGTSYYPRLNVSGDQPATGGEQEINFTQDETYSSENVKSLTTEKEEHKNNLQENEVAPTVQQKPALSEHSSPQLDPLDRDQEQVAPLDEHSVQIVPAAGPNGNGGDDDALTDTYEEDVQDEPKDPRSGVAHIHPVVVIYEGNEISLFPPSKNDTSDTFFLPDESLARANICDLFEAIRSVLAGSIGEDDELDMIVDGLGLELSEDSIYARTTTLSQIVDLHVQLFHQDGVDEPDPLYMALTTKVRFSKRFNDIVCAAAEGRGISQLPFWHSEGQDDGFPTENTSHSEDTDHHSGWEADYSSHQDYQSPAKDSDNPDMAGSGCLGASPDAASLPTSPSQDLQRQSSAVHSATPVADQAVDSVAIGDEINEIRESTAKVEDQDYLKEDRPRDKPAVLPDHVDVSQGTTNYPVEDELHDDDLIDYDDDDDDGAGQYHSTGSSTLQSDDRRISNEAEYTTVNDAASRRSSIGKSSHGASKDPPKDEAHSGVEQGVDLDQTGVSGYDEDYGQYNDENDYGGSQQYGDEAEHTQSDVFEDPESTGPNEYIGFEEPMGNEYAINPEDWTSNEWHPVEQEITGENDEEYYQQETIRGDGIETEQANDNRHILEHTNLDLHFGEETQERSAHGSLTEETGHTDGFRLAPSDVPAPNDISSGQRLQEAERSSRVEEDDVLYDDDEDGDVFGDTLYGRDESLGTSDSGSQTHRDSTKRPLDEIEYGNELEGDRQAGTKRVRSR
ncbi:MAG: hypothetical protein M1840_005941 [Geoglossum simile]|nr:MAG: hypothetical protein M1840_005941 [Geoglossum simile]